jgi:16S rRNA (cytidine1402-2'-O)-methyltransferase
VNGTVSMDYGEDCGYDYEHQHARVNESRSNRKAMAGVLYIVGTPIGNLEDMTLRAIRVLGEVDCVAAEDTRVTRKLFARYGIGTRLVSCHDANERERAEELAAVLRNGGSVALSSDAGMPGLSDPGYRLIRRAVEEGARVEVVPGPSAVIAALSVSGLPAGRFFFGGFLPRRDTARRKEIANLLFQEWTAVYFESPARLRRTLQCISDILGPDRRVVVARELTKVNEEVIRGSARDVLRRSEEKAVKGEIVLCIGGVGEEHSWKKIEPAEHLRIVGEQLGLDRMESIKLVARMRGVARDAVYKIALKKKGKCTKN